MIKVIKSPKVMQKVADSLRAEGKKISFVPTMGYLHEGHLALMRKARKLGDIVVVSIFVNPIQFLPHEDFKAYPRDFKRDRRLIQEVGVDIVFCPKEKDMYPEGFQTKVEVERLQKYLCGISRPGHFKGVTTVVAKLFNIVKPHYAVFGLKDYQQALIIKRMVKDLNFDLKIVLQPTLREKDGLAMSSRNTYLTEEERKIASAIPKSIELAQKLVDEGIVKTEEIEKRVLDFLGRSGITKVDYVKVVHSETLEDIKMIESKALFALAVFVGKARLIDSCILKGSKKEVKG